MRRFLVLVAFCALGLTLVACGDDDTEVNVSGDVPQEETEGSTEPEGSDTTEADNTGSEGTDSDGTSSDDDAEADVPTSEEICEAIVTPLEAIYGTATEQEAGDSNYPSCEVEFEPAKVVVSAFALNDPLVGGDFDAYIENVGETVQGLEPLDGVGDAAVANETGQAFVLLGENIVTVSRAFSSDAGDSADLESVATAVADALG